MLIYISGSTLPSKMANSVHVMKMCEAFCENGEDILLFARKHGGSIADIFEYYGISKKFNLILISNLKIKYLRSIYYVMNIIYNLIKIRKERFIIYTRYFQILPLLFLFRSKVIYESHEIKNSRINGFLEYIFLRFFIKKIVVISNRLKEMYLEKYHFLDNDNIIVAHDGANLPKNPVDNGGVALYKSNNKNSFDKVYEGKIGYIGQLYKGRGIDLLLNIAERMQNYQFIIVGGFQEDVNYWKKYAKSPNVFFVGYVKHSDVYYYYQIMDILLAPYQKKVGLAAKNTNTSGYMSPLKIFEYMAAKKPIICSDLEVLKEVLTPNQHAIMVDPENSTDWIKAIKNILSDKQLALSLSQNAYNHLLKMFTWEKRAENVLQHIHGNKKQ